DRAADRSPESDDDESKRGGATGGEAPVPGSVVEDQMLARAGAHRIPGARRRRAGRQIEDHAPVRDVSGPIIRDRVLRLVTGLPGRDLDVIRSCAEGECGSSDEENCTGNDRRSSQLERVMNGWQRHGGCPFATTFSVSSGLFGIVLVSIYQDL